jgi:hypothetical protein
MPKAKAKKGRGKTHKVRDLAVKSRASRGVKGGGTKTTTPPKPTPKAFEIEDFSFGVENPT